MKEGGIIESGSDAKMPPQTAGAINPRTIQRRNIRSFQISNTLASEETSAASPAIQRNLLNSIQRSRPSLSQFKSQFGMSPKAVASQGSLDDNLSSTMNKPTFNTAQRPKYHATNSSWGNDYLSSMKQMEVKRLSRQLDDEVGRVTAKQKVLQQLQFELEQIRLVSGNLSESSKSPLSKKETCSPKNDNEEVDHNFGRSLTHFSRSMSMSSQIIQPAQSKVSSQIRADPELRASLYYPYYKMTLDDDTISANLMEVKQMLLDKVKETEYKTEQEQVVHQQLLYQQSGEKKQITSYTIKHREVIPDVQRYQQAVARVPRVKMLGDTAKEMQKHLVSERRKQLERKRQFYHGVLQTKVNQLKVQSRELDDLQAAISKRQKRIDEVKEYLYDLKSTNKDEESKKHEIVSQLLNKNLEFKVLSGLEIILKLEEALKTLDHGSERGVEVLQKVMKDQIHIDVLTEQDFENMNKRKIEKLQKYEEHFTSSFADLNAVTINDEYLQKRYDEICFSIHSKSSRYQELIHAVSFKKKLISQFLRHKEAMKRDQKFLAKYSLTNSKERQITLNDMRSSELQIRSSVMQQDQKAKLQALAQIFSLMQQTLSRACFFLKEVLQIIRFEEPYSSKDKIILVPIVNYMNVTYLRILASYAPKFQPDAPMMLLSEGADRRSSGRSTLKDSPKSESEQSTPASGPRRRKTSSIQITKEIVQDKVVGSAQRKSKFVSQNTRKMTFHNKSSSFVLLIEDNTHRYQQGEKFACLYLNTDITTKDFTQLEEQTLTDFSMLVRVLFQSKEHMSLVNHAEAVKICHTNALSYIMHHKLLSTFYDNCKNTLRLNLDPHVYIHGLEYSIKYPDSNKARFRANDIYGHADPMAEDSVTSEVDYVDPQTKHIVPKLLLWDRTKDQLEEQRLKKEADRQRRLAKMTEVQRKFASQKHLRQQEHGLQSFEKDERAFRSQFKSNMTQAFSKQMPNTRSTRDYLALTGHALSTATASLLRKRDKPASDIQVATIPVIQRQRHVRTHHGSSQVSTIPSMMSLNSDIQLHTQRIFNRRSFVKIQKPQPKQQNVVLQMLQDRFPELQQLFMDTAERRVQRRNENKLNHFDSQGHISSSRKVAPIRKGTHKSSSTLFQTDEAPPFSEGFTQEDAVDFGTQETPEPGDYYLDSPIIKVKPVFPRGVLR